MYFYYHTGDLVVIVTTYQKEPGLKPGTQRKSDWAWEDAGDLKEADCCTESVFKMTVSLDVFCSEILNLGFLVRGNVFQITEPCLHTIYCIYIWLWFKWDMEVYWDSNSSKQVLLLKQ